ncbi:hypothetical protein [Actinosynnema mirum]|uniref:Uncharacterized protein n=1 Tax=Actinosynnema mirum (strain ATCC 29888 / DSM 43827 / JCM 3225 / NBRC 14064 / NCIMB 13271 / NRRL B-12336 / IMRU 3971 / 101) TaxID=446462 RepID=C6W9S4_ACTMD|nr:hypothetical protein [Actinosynnema mirum]ACU37291.1 hypothetical protein Amir_3392 [Actinosynnema mirum DSM 43827]
MPLAGAPPDGELLAGGCTLAVGCDGTLEEWGTSVKATVHDSTYRRLLCDDEHLVDLSGECRDEAPP